MARSELDATEANLEGLLEGRRIYQAPLLQRRFVWTRAELDELWDDIDAVLDGIDKARFLGAIVLQFRSGGLALKPITYWIIDGQQRLTTLYVFLIALIESARGLRQNALATDLYALLVNQSAKHAREPKVRPTNPDLRQFGDILSRLEDDDLALPPAYGWPRGRLRTMHEMILGDIDARLAERKPRYLKQLADVLLQKLKVVQILTSDEENPHQVFDRLNSAGQRLETVDLIRNVVFGKVAATPKLQETFYTSTWAPFEESLGDQVNGYFFPFMLIMNPNTTQARVFGELKKRWRYLSADALAEDLRQYVPEYRAILGEVEADGSPQYRSAVARLSRMPVPTVTYPFLMKLMNQVRHGAFPEPAALNLLRLVEAFLVRRAIAGLEPTGLHAIFKRLWEGTGGDQRKVLRTIDENPTVHFPSDLDFAKAVVLSDLYHRRLARYVLMEYDLDLPGGDPVPLQVKVGQSIQPLISATTIDHLMPQELGEPWMTVISRQAHDRLLHTWANLVPMTQSFNSSKGSKGWLAVRKQLEKESIYKTPRLVAKTAVWNERAIQRRSKLLAKWAVRRWPRDPR